MMGASGRGWTVPLAVALGLGLAACGGGRTTVGASRSPRRAPNSASGPSAALSLSRLSSLTNYTFVSSAGGASESLRVTGKVHTATDWESHTQTPSVTTYDVGGHGYAVVGGPRVNVTFQTPDGVNHLDGEHVYAAELMGYTHVTGIRISTAGACSVAGTAGTVYDVKSPSASASLLVETATACVADGSGALLSYSGGVQGGAAASAAHLTGMAMSFRVTSIGGVGRIAAPAATSTASPPAVPSSAMAPSGLPASLPSGIPAPPGKILTSSQISPSKWYLQVSEKNASAISQYVAALRAKGFGVTSTTQAAGSEIDLLSRGSVQIELVQVSFPGQGVILQVTVASQA